MCGWARRRAVDTGAPRRSMPGDPEAAEQRPPRPRDGLVDDDRGHALVVDEAAQLGGVVAGQPARSAACSRSDSACSWAGTGCPRSRRRAGSESRCRPASARWAPMRGSSARDRRLQDSGGTCRWRRRAGPGSACSRRRCPRRGRSRPRPGRQAPAPPAPAAPVARDSANSATIIAAGRTTNRANRTGIAYRRIGSFSSASHGAGIDVLCPRTITCVPSVHNAGDDRDPTSTHACAGGALARRRPRSGSPAAAPDRTRCPIPRTAAPAGDGHQRGGQHVGGEVGRKADGARRVLVAEEEEGQERADRGRPCPRRRRSAPGRCPAVPGAVRASSA